MMGVIMGVNFSSSEWRPSAVAAVRMSLTNGATPADVQPPMKRASAWFAPNAFPAFDEPAWNETRIL
jgi:hypothetical protein